MKPTKKILWARQCDVTEEGMNDGWCWGDGHFHTKYEKDTIAELRKDHPDRNIFSDEELLEWAYDEEILYWTEWECEDDIQWEEVNGELIEFEQ